MWSAGLCLAVTLNYLLFVVALYLLLERKYIFYYLTNFAVGVIEIIDRTGHGALKPWKYWTCLRIGAVSTCSCLSPLLFDSNTRDPEGLK